MMPSNDADANGIECRICHSKTTRDLILSPCLCKGSMGCVHIGCLEQWLNVSSHAFCELCSYRFDVIQARRYSLCQSIRVWFRRDQGTIYKALFFIILSAVNLALIAWMWFLWMSNVPHSLVKREPTTNKAESVDLENQMEEDLQNEEMSTAKWMVVFVFLSLLTLFSVKSLCIDSYKVTRHQCRAWYRWWNETVNIQLVLDLQNYKITSKLEELKDLSVKFTNQEKQENDNEEASNLEEQHELCVKFFNIGKQQNDNTDASKIEIQNELPIQFLNQEKQQNGNERHRTQENEGEQSDLEEVKITQPSSDKDFKKMSDDNK